MCGNFRICDPESSQFLFAGLKYAAPKGSTVMQIFLAIKKNCVTKIIFAIVLISIPIPIMVTS